MRGLHRLKKKKNIVQLIGKLGERKELYKMKDSFLSKMKMGSWQTGVDSPYPNVSDYRQRAEIC